MNTPKLRLFCISICLLCSFAFNAKSQQLPEFAPLGAKWTYAYHWFAHTGFAGTEVIGLDTIKGQPCKVFPSHAFESRDSCFLYQDSLTIYVYEPNVLHDWIVFMDFSLSVGDTWIWPRYVLNEQKLDTLITKVVAKGDTIINGFSLPYMDVFSTKRITWDCGYGSPWDTTQTDRIVWSLGSLRYGGFYMHDCYITDGAPGVFLCYDDTIIGHTENLYHPFITCDSVDISINIDPEHVYSFSVSPNPTNSHVRVQLESRIDLKDTRLELTDLQGKTLLRWDAPFQVTSANVNLEGVQQGCYILRLMRGEHQLATSKILKSSY